MARDNLSLLFNVAAAPPASRPTTNVSSSSDSTHSSSSFNKTVTNNFGRRHRESNRSIRLKGTETSLPARTSSTSATVDGSATERSDATITRDCNRSDGDLLVGFADDSPAPASAPPPAAPAGEPSNDARPGAESIRYLKKFGSNIGSIALKPLRELQLAEKLNAMNLEMEETQNRKELERKRRDLEAMDGEAWVDLGGDESEDRSELLARELQDREEEDECTRIKVEADMACQRVAGRYDALLRFLRTNPRGTYEEYVEFLLMGGGGTENEGLGEDYDSLLFENFYDKNSEYRKLWNDNLTTGLPFGASTLEGRTFVPAAASADAAEGDSSLDPWHTHSAEVRQRNRTISEDERKFGQTLRERTLSESERILAGVDREKIRQGFGSAVNAISNASAFALKPLRDLQLAEQINAMNVDMEEAEARRQIEKYNMLQEEDRDMAEAMRLKREAEESCLAATREHLLGFVRENPRATYNQWIEDLHPENAHDGALLEGLGKTIDHRFFVEESDHRRLWNENLFTYLDPSSKGRDFVPGRARLWDDKGETSVPADILSGSTVGKEGVARQNHEGRKLEPLTESADLIVFD